MADENETPNERDTKMRFATKEAAAAHATGKYAGFYPVFVSDAYAPAHGLPCGGWYLFHGRGSSERIAF